MTELVKFKITYTAGMAAADNDHRQKHGKAVEAGERQHTCSEEARAGVKLRVAMQERDAISGKGSQKIAQHDHEEADCKVTDEQRLAPHG